MPGGAIGTSDRDAEFAKLVKEIVKHLALSLRNVRSYPSGHPFVTRSLSETHRLLSQALRGKRELVVVLFENALMIEGHKVDRKAVPAVHGFTKDMLRTDIRSITFSQAVGPEDIQKLLQVMAMDRLKLQDAGGAIEAFKKTGLRTIGLNEVEYGIITKKGSPTAKSASLDWKSFIESLRASGAVVPANVGQVADFLASEGEGEGATDGQTAFSNMERVVSSMLSFYGDDRKKDFARWFANFVAGVKPVLETKLEDKDAFESKMATLIRRNLSLVSDAELVETMMEAATRKGAKRDEDIAREARAFLDALSIQEEKSEDLLEKLQRKILSEGGPGGPGPALSGDTVVTSKESLKTLKEKASSTLGTEDVDAMIEPFMKTLEDPSADVRRKGAESLGEMLLGLIDKEKYSIAERSVMVLKEKMEREEDFPVYVAYVSVLERIARKMRKAERTDIADKIQDVFAEHISSEQKRKRAVQALGKVGGKDALASLLAALWESGIYREVREAIVGMGKEAMPMVMDLFRVAEDKLLRRRMIDLIRNIGPNAIPYLLDASQDESWFVRRDIATILSNFEDPGAVYVLEKLSRDQEFTVREAALEAMSKIRGPDAENILIEALKDPSDKVRATVTRLLANRASDKGALALSGIALESTNEELQKEICGTLGHMGREVAVEPLSKLVQETVFLGRHKYADSVRVNALFALAKIGGDVARAVIEKATKDKSRPVQIAAQSALKRMKPDEGASKG